MEELSKDEVGEIEKVVESVVRDSLIKRYSLIFGSLNREVGAEVLVFGIGFKRWVI